MDGRRRWLLLPSAAGNGAAAVLVSAILYLNQLYVHLSFSPLYSFSLIAAALVYFLFGPALQDSDGNNEGSGLRCGDVDLPVTLYSSLFAMLVVQILVAVNEEVIFLVSARGTVWNDKPRRWLPKLLYLRVVMFVVDVVTLVYATWAVFNGETVAQLAACASYSTALRLSGAIVLVVWITLAIYALGFLIYLDPAGCFSSTSLLDELHFHDKQEEVDSPFYKQLKQSGRSLHRSHIEHRRLLRRLQKCCSLFGIQDAAETTIALNDLAHSLYKMFHNVELVPTDLFVGFQILHRDHKKKMKRGGFLELTTPLREVKIYVVMNECIWLYKLWLTVHAVYCIGCFLYMYI